MAENKSEIKPFLFKKYIYCVLKTDLVRDYSSFQRGKSTSENKSTRRSHTVAANCCALACGAGGGGDKKVLYNHENSSQQADLFLVYMSD